MPFGPRIVSSGTNVVWSGMTSRATRMTNTQSRPRNSIHENAYAAKQPTAIGMIVAGMVISRLFTNACAMPFLARTWA